MAQKLTGTFNAAGQSGVFRPEAGKAFNITLSSSFTGSVQLERQFNEIGDFYPLTALGSAIAFTGPCSEIFEEPEAGTAYRLNATSMSGTCQYRISQ